MDNKTRRSLGLWSLVGAVAIGAIALFVNKSASDKARVSALLGGSGSGDKTLVWVLAAAAVILLLVAVWSFLSTGQEPDPRTATTVKCPHCAELVQPEAKVCKHCGRDIQPAVSG